MDLKKFDVVKNLIVTPKSKNSYDKFGVITFEVGVQFNKVEIKHAVEGIWNVKVQDVRTMIVKGKTGSFARKRFEKTVYKKAIVKLAKGYKIVLPWDAYSTNVVDQVEANPVDATVVEQR